MSLTPVLTPTVIEDPLAGTGERLPLAWPRCGQPAGVEATGSPVGIRPFGLRFAVKPGGQVAVLPLWRYDVDRQIAVDWDGQPWYRHLVDMMIRTTGPSPDGTGNTGGEEWTPDYMSDEDA
jgi:putative ATP-grasp target RiPP